MQMNLTLYFFDDEKSLDMAKSDKNIYVGVVEQKDLSDFIAFYKRDTGTNADELAIDLICSSTS